MNGDGVKHFGGCHCGFVRFEVLAPAEIEARTGMNKIIA
jgi:hypothetical protein